MRNSNGQFMKGYHWRKRKPWWDKEWLHREYIERERSTEDIAKDGGVRDTAIQYWLIKHDIPRRSTKETRQIKHWGQCGEDNPMWNRRGSENPRWKGGVTPERQAFYTSEAWKKACRAVYGRDNATCQRCAKQRKERALHVHHIESFANKKKRAEIDNLVLLCLKCHRFVHSRKNIEHEYLSEIEYTRAST